MLYHVTIACACVTTMSAVTPLSPVTPITVLAMILTWLHITWFNLTHFCFVAWLSTIFAVGLNHPFPFVVSTITIDSALPPHAPLAKNAVNRVRDFLTRWWWLQPQSIFFGHERIASLHLQKASITLSLLWCPPSQSSVHSPHMLHSPRTQSTGSGTFSQDGGGSSHNPFSSDTRGLHPCTCKRLPSPSAPQWRPEPVGNWEMIRALSLTP